MTTSDLRSLPAGTGAADEWLGGTRVIFRAERGVAGHPVWVRTAAIQRQDGTIDTDPKRELDRPHVTVRCADVLSAGQARRLAATLLEAADELTAGPAELPSRRAAGLRDRRLYR